MISVSIIFSNNAYIELIKLWCLTNSVANCVLVITVALITIKKKNKFLLYMTFAGLAPTSLLLPLSNTFFAIHPPLLMIGVCICVICLSKQSTNAWVGLLMLGFAMLLGGFWSMQELNWGGWWNWDVLELGSLIVWLIAIVSIHSSRSSRSFITLLILFVTVTITFYILNKTGVGVSIHSFVTSNVIKLNYFILCLMAILWLLTFHILYIIVVLFCTLIYISLIDARLFKQIVIIVILWSIIPNSWQRPLHTLAFAISLFIFLFNFYNIPLTGGADIMASSNRFITGEKLQLGHRSIQILHTTGWRSKPLLTYGSCFTSSYLRSPSGRYRWAAYIK